MDWETVTRVIIDVVGALGCHVDKLKKCDPHPYSRINGIWVSIENYWIITKSNSNFIKVL